MALIVLILEREENQSTLRKNLEAEERSTVGTQIEWHTPGLVQW